MKGGRRYKCENFGGNTFRSSHPEVFCNKSALKNFTQLTRKPLYWGLFFNKVAGLRLVTLSKKKTPTQVFSCEFCEIFNNTFFHRTPLVAASYFSLTKMKKLITKGETDKLS